MAKELFFDSEAREKMKRGVDTLANAVKVTLGPKGRNVIIDKKFGSPSITKDGVSVAKEIELEDPVNGTVWAYVSRNSALGKTMLTLLADGKGHRIIVQIAADRSEDESGSLCILTQLVSDNWLKN